MTVTPVKSLDQFKQIISQDKITIFDFWATWCGPCVMISPVFEKIAETITSVEYYKVDVDAHQDISQEVGIRAMPTFVAFKGGEEVKKLVGPRPNQLEEFVKSLSGL